MVTRLESPATDDAALIDSLVEQNIAGKNATHFLQIKDAWKARVQEYIDVSGDPVLLQPWPAIAKTKKIFENLYSSKPLVNSAQKPILDSLRTKMLQFCPACGEDGTPNTLDHYLPKVNYPEFSVTSRNLFPMCDICQGKKGSKTVNAAQQRLFVHPYFDQFVELSILRLVIGRPFESPTSISILPHPNLDAKQSELISRHLAELGIASRYDKFFRSEYLRLRRLVSRTRADGHDVRERIESFLQHASDKTTNSWGAVFYRGVLDDDELMQFLENGAQSAYP